jgi:hypothetical protein
MPSQLLVMELIALAVILIGSSKTLGEPVGAMPAISSFIEEPKFARWANPGGQLQRRLQPGPVLMCLTKTTVNIGKISAIVLVLVNIIRT